MTQTLKCFESCLRDTAVAKSTGKGATNKFFVSRAKEFCERMKGSTDPSSSELSGDDQSKSSGFEQTFHLLEYMYYSNYMVFVIFVYKHIA